MAGRFFLSVDITLGSGLVSTLWFYMIEDCIHVYTSVLVSI